MTTVPSSSTRLAIAVLLLCASGTTFAASAEKRLHSLLARDVYRGAYRDAPGHKAFAQSGNGMWAWAAGKGSAAEARDAALADCRANAGPEAPDCIVFDLDGDLPDDAEAAERKAVEAATSRHIDGLLAAIARSDRDATSERTNLLQRLYRAPSASTGLALDNYVAGVMLVNDGKYADAVGPLRAAAEACPGVRQFHYALAVALLNSGRLQDANKAVRDAIALQVEEPSSWTLQAVILARMGKPEEARASILAAYEVAPRRDREKTLAAMLDTQKKETDPVLQDLYRQLQSRLEAYAAALAVTPAPRGALSEAEEDARADGRIYVDYSSCEKPAYPEQAQRAGQMGNVMLAFRLDDAGRVQEAVILQSSGTPLLDTTSVKALTKCRFAVPPRRGPEPRKADWSAVQYRWILQ